MNKHPEITERTRQAFCKAFCELYAHKPIEKITVNELARATGYNRSTFYQYFSDIYDVLDSVESDLFVSIRSVLDETGTASRPAFQNALLLFEEHELVLRALLGDYGQIHFIEKLKNEVSTTDPAWNLPESSHLSAYLEEFHLTTIVSMFRLWVHRGKDLEKKQLFSLIEDLYTTGIQRFTE